jgi:hypothetical protein
MSPEPNIDPFHRTIDEAAMRRDTDITTQLDAQQAMRNAPHTGNTAPLISLAVMTALTVPLLFATMRGASSFVTSEAPESSAT